MSTYDRLLRTIYHEKQEPGSMLCAQHALNSLFQANYFTAPALSDIARNLDAMESSYDASHSGSTNMDDTGFFSIQVLDQALSFWGLNLVRWRGEDMRPYHDRPHTQLAFILNLEQHWYTLRRFGVANPNIDRDEGAGHWFNLDSLQPMPKWVGRTYLGMTIQQAEADGYSVFAVVQADPEAPLALARTDADDLAAVVSEDEIVAVQRAGTHNVTSDSAPAPSSSSSRVPAGFEGIEGLEDEDYELQAALHMSMGAGEMHSFNAPPTEPPPLRRATAPLPPVQSSDVRTPTRGSTVPQPLSQPQEDEDVNMEEEEDADPIAASMARNRQLLQRMQAQQEYMHRELNQGEDDEATTRRAARQRQEQEAEDELQRVLEESRRMAEEHEQRMLQQPQPDANDGFGDIEDEELKAALQASMASVPEGWSMPDRSDKPPTEAPTPVPAPAAAASSITRSDSVHTERTESPDPTASEASQDDIPAQEVSMEELRRRRLARFGA